MTPAEKRARAKELRKEARRLDQEADTDEAIARREAEIARARAREEEAIDAEGNCRPVWRLAPAPGRFGGPVIVRDVVDGCFLLGRANGAGEVVAYPIRGSGWRRGTWGMDVVPFGRLDVEATLLAWRTYCDRRAGRSS